MVPGIELHMHVVEPRCKGEPKLAHSLWSGCSDTHQISLCSWFFYFWEGVYYKEVEPAFGNTPEKFERFAGHFCME